MIKGRHILVFCLILLLVCLFGSPIKSAYAEESQPADSGGISGGQVNTAPSFTKGSDITVFEDAEPQIISNWAKNISKGEAGEEGQTLTFDINTTKDSLFSSLPSIDPANGDLAFTTAANVNGTATITVILEDDGGTADGGVDSSTPQTFTIEVKAVNDAPSFTINNNLTVLQNAGCQTVTKWATGISSGPPDEAGQVLTFSLSGYAESLFAIPPSIDANGTLTYTPAPNASGTTNISVVLNDDGGTSNGGENTFGPQTFTITVNRAIDEPQYTAKPIVTGIVKVGEELKASTGAWNNTDPDATDIAYTYQWQIADDEAGKNTADISGATTDTFKITTGQAHKYVHVKVIAVAKGSELPDSKPAEACSDWILVENAVPSIQEGETKDVTVDEDSTTTFKLTTSDTDGDTINWSIETGGANGTAAAASGTGSSMDITYTPKSNYNGSDSFVVRISDGQGSVDTITVNVTVNSIIDAPINDVLPQVSGTMKVGQTLTAATGTWNDVADGDSAVITYSYQWMSADDSKGTNTHIISGATEASFNLTAGQAHKYVCIKVTAAAKDKNLPESDGATAEAYSNWAPVENAVPVIDEGDTFTADPVNEDSTVTFTLNASDIDGDIVTWSIESDGTNGSAAISGMGSSRDITYTPDGDFNGTDSFVVKVSDSSGGTDTIRVNITVNSVNDVPSFTNGGDQTVLEDCGLQTVSVWATNISSGAANESEQALTFGIKDNDNPALFSVGPAISSDGTLTYTPAPNKFGDANITIVLTDNGGTVDGGINESQSQTFKISITNVNDAPSFIKGADQRVSEDCGTQTVPEWATAISKGNLDESGQTLEFFVSNNNNSLFSVQPEISAEGTLTYTTADNASGKATITVYLKDNGGSAGGGKDTSTTQTFVITVDPVNDKPVIGSIADLTMNEDEGTKSMAFTVSDVDNAPGLLSITAVSSNHNLLLDSSLVIGGSGNNRTISFTPLLNQFGTSEITVTVSDGDFQVETYFTVTVASVNDLPVISNIADQTINEDGSTGNIAFTVGDVETLTKDLAVTFASDNLTLFPDGAIKLGGTDEKRYISLKPAGDLSGSAKVTVTVTDSDGDTKQTSFNIVVNAVNDYPTLIVPDMTTVNEDNSTDDLSITVEDKETTNADSLIVLASSGNTNIIANGGIKLSGSGKDRKIMLTPVTNASGAVTITVSVDDTTGGVTTKTFIVDVLPVNDTPVIYSVTDKTINEDSAPENNAFTFTIGDVDNNVDDLVVTATSSDTTIISSEGIILGGSGDNRTIKLKPVHDKYGETIITLTVTDYSGAFSSTTFKVNVSNVNDAPWIGPIANQEIGSSCTLEIPFNIWDIDDDLSKLVLHADYDSKYIDSIVFGGSNNNRTIIVTSKGSNIKTPITVTVEDVGGKTDSTQFTLDIITGGPGDPIISYIPDQATSEDTPTGYIYFDVKSDYGDNVTVVSSNPSIIPNDSSHILLEKLALDTRQKYRVNLKPELDANGTVTFTVTATSTGGELDSRTFKVNVTPVNDAPVIVIQNKSVTVNEDNPVPANIITISDVDNGDNLTVKVMTNDEVLFPAAQDGGLLFPAENIIVTGSPTQKTINLTPAANRHGSTMITVWVTDSGGITVTDNIHITVNSVNDAPTIAIEDSNGDINDVTIDEDTPSKPIPFIVDDVELAAGNLTVSAVSSNPDIISAGNISFGGSGKNRTLTIKPMPNMYTTNNKVTITVTVSDGELQAFDSFDVTVNPVNDAPYVNFIANQTIDEDHTAGPISFTVGDIDSDESLLKVTDSSSNKALVPDGSITLEGIGKNWTITLVPVENQNSVNQNGDTVITITVSDHEGAVSQRTFKLHVTPVNDAPLVYNPDDATKKAPLDDITIDEDNSADGIRINIEDIEDINPGDLTIAVVSGNETLLPKENIKLDKVTGEANAYTLSLKPDTNQNGIVIVTFKVTDKDNATTVKSFNLNVTPVNDHPTISDIGNLAINEDASTTTIGFTVDDIEKTAGSLVVTAESSKESLVPNTNIILGGTGANRTIKLIPLPDQFGETTITVTVSDGDHTCDTKDTFVLTVNPINDVPSFNIKGDMTVLEDVPAQTMGSFATNISKGPSNEDDQTLVFDVTNDKPELFSAQPGITSDGTLTFTPGKDANGEVVVKVIARDYGGESNAPDAISGQQTFKITITPVNDVPVFAKGEDQAVLEDAGAKTVNGWATSISTGAANESQTLSFTVTTSKDSLFAAKPSIDTATGNLTYTLAADANGSATVTVTLKDNGDTGNGGQNTSASQTFTITVTQVNDAPSFAKGGNQSVNEDAGLQTISAWATATKAGPSDESGQAIDFIVTTNNDGLFSVLPTIDSLGKLTYKPADNANGVATVTVKLHDNGGTADGGSDTSVPQTFTITVNAVNDPPTFDMISTNQSVLEDSGAVSVSGWVTNMSAGPENESTQTLTLTVGCTNSSLFSSLPAIDKATGILTFTPALNANGSSTVTVTLKDSSGGTNTRSKTFTITIKAVNDAPKFTISSNITVDEDAGAQTVSSWATGISKGGSDESSQILNFIVTSNTNPGIFSVQPAIDPSGKLTYTLKPNANGAAKVTIKLKDNGGTADGGADTSAEQTFTITVNAINDPPANTQIPSIAGTAEAGRTVTANKGEWNDDAEMNPTTISYYYQWQNADDASGTNAADILGAEGSSYTIGTAQAHKYIRVKITAVDDGEGLPPSQNTTVCSVWVQVRDVTKPVISLNGSDDITLEAGSKFEETATASDNYDGDITGKMSISKTLDINTPGDYTITYDVEDTAGNKADQVVRTIHVIPEITQIRVEGQITEKDGSTPIAGALVSLKGLNGEEVKHMLTDGSGNYSFDNVILGNYKLVAEKTGYSTRMVEIKVAPNSVTDQRMVKNMNLVKFVITLDSNPRSIVGDGTSESTLTAVVMDKENVPIKDVTVTFTADMGSFPGGIPLPDGKYPKEITAVTGSDGKCSVTYRSQDIQEGIPNIQDVKSILTVVRAEVDDDVRDLHAYTEILVTFDPSCVQGVVRDNDSGIPVEGALVEVSKDGDGIMGFYSKMVTGPDGSYKIAVPKGNTTYDIKITKPVKIGDSINNVTFNQTLEVGNISGLGDTIKAQNIIAGLILSMQTDGSTKRLADYSGFTIKVLDDKGNPATDKDDHPISGSLGNGDTGLGTFQAAGLISGETYKVNVTYKFDNGEELQVGTATVTVSTDGETSISTILIDPYGIITDASTHQPISDVQVTLKYADTGEIVVLPKKAGFGPSDNANPQKSSSIGEYAYLVYPDTDYIITATRAGYQDYVSDPIHVGKLLVQFDFSMEPIPHSGGSGGVGTAIFRLSGQQRVDTAIEIAKATFTGRVKNVILATSENFPDALAGSVLGYKVQAPILLVSSDNADQEKVLSYIREYMDNAGTVYILGGTGAVNEEMELKVRNSGYAKIKRLGGVDRYETAALIAKELDVREGTPAVFASGENYPDALSISSIAAMNQYPILLVSKDGICDAIKNEIAELKPEKVYIIGLQGAVSSDVENLIASISALNRSNIVRIGGVDRYETSFEVAKYFDLSSQSICAATGNNFPDIIAGSIYAAIKESPIILVDTGISDSIKTYMNNKKVEKVIIFGGEGAVSKSIEDQLSQIIQEIKSKN